jgi:hypothetical protein
MNEPAKKQHDSHHAAVLAVFPDLATLDEFQLNEPVVAGTAVPRFVEYAFEHGLIDEPTEGCLRAMIEQARRDPSPLPDGFSFGDLIDRMSAGRSVNQFVEADLRPICRQLGLPDAQTSMISRGRGRFVPNTRGKQNLLRALAFWIGLNRPAWAWTFPSLMRLRSPEKPAFAIDPKHGVRLAFHVVGKGELLEADALTWLRRELVQCTKELEIFYVDRDQIVASTATVFVNLPRGSDGSEDASRYSRALRDAFALVHQMLVRWALNEVCSGIRLVVGVDAGAFADLDTSLQAMVKARLPDGGVARMSGFVRSCVNLAEIKVVFDPTPREVAVYAGDTVTVWVAESLWSHLYYDHVPAVEKLLPSDMASLATYRLSVLMGDQKGNPILAAAARQPGNPLLLIDLAKGCAAKGMFSEADRFVSMVLADRPLHVVARTLRLILRLNMGLAQPDLSAAWVSFQDALREGAFILERCQVENEEAYCEMGQVHFSIARRLYNAVIRNHAETLGDALREISGQEPGAKQDARSLVRPMVIDHLRQAQRYFDQGRTVSPSGMGNRASHWALRISALRQLLERDEEAFVADAWPGQVVVDRHDVFRRTAMRFFAAIGWAIRVPEPGKAYSDEEQAALFAGILRAFEHYDSVVRSPSYRATVQLAFAMLMFDFAPTLNVGLLKFILKWMREAEVVAESLADKPRGVRSIVTCCSHIQPAGAMLAQVRQASGFLTDRYADALRGDDSRPIEEGRDHKFLLEAFGNEYLVDPCDLL